MSGLRFYRLENRIALPCKSLMEAAEGFSEEGKRVRYSEIGPVSVSTVFLVLDHSWGEGDPVLFETMIYTPLSDLMHGQFLNYQTRCGTWAEAEDMHEQAVAYVAAQLRAIDRDLAGIVRIDRAFDDQPL